MLSELDISFLVGFALGFFGGGIVGTVLLFFHLLKQWRL